MVEQYAQAHPQPARTTGSRSAEGAIFDWIDAWQLVREDVLQLMETYATSATGHDVSSFEPLIEELDASLRLLRHRVGWLRNNLGHDTN